MKSFITFLAGIVTGVLLAIFIPQYLNSSSEVVNDDGMTLFSEAGDVLDYTQFRVIQVVENGNALAVAQSDIMSSLLPNDAPAQLRNIQMPTTTVVLLLADEKDHYYDDKIVNVPNTKYARQVGVYKYITSDEFEKTVPIVAFKAK